MTSTIGIDSQRRKAVWGPKRSLAFAATVALVAGLASNALAAGPQRPPAAKAVPGAPGSSVKPYKLDKALTDRAAHGNPIGVSTVIVRLVPGGKLPAEFKKYAHGGSLDIINALVLDVPNGALKALANNPNVASVHDDRPVKTHNYRTSVTVGARAVQDFLGYTGAGVGVAVIDSGVATWHDDLTNKTSKIYPYGNQRVAKFVDFVNGRALPYDDNGHGSHVAGIIAGNGYDSLGEKAGIAPGASLVSLKVLDANGQGTISSIIAALNWIATNNKTYNIRVVNLSVGAPIHESYWTDPLTLACKRVNDLGITIVVAAGNMGKNAAGQLQWGAITAPGNAPWVLTVGASSTMGTLTRLDDTMAGFSSSGPTFIDYNAKPDLVAPGVGTVSLAVPGSTFYATKTSYLLAGKLSLGYKPYLTLSGTSMAAPVVSGSIALMLQANPNLTPNLIKAILQYTAQQYPGYSALRQGAGFVNTLGAVRLAKFYADNRAGTQMPTQLVWSKQLIWGSHRLKGGYINPLANAWRVGVVWGSAKTLVTDGDNIVWGTACADCDNIVWGTADTGGANIVWGTVDAGGDNIVWGTAYNGDNVVWGTVSDGDNIVWGTNCGGADCDNVVWGTADADNIVWGTIADGDNVVWGTACALGDCDNIVWGTSSDSDVTWGSDSPDETVYPDDANLEPLPSIDLEFGDTVPLMTDPSSATDATTPIVSTTTTIGGGL